MQGAPYRQPAPVPPDPYLVAWARLRRRRRWIWMGFVTLMALVGALFGRVSLPPSWRAFAIVFGSLMAIPLGLFLLARLPPFPCPACGHAFFRLVGGEVSSADRCEHCDLVIGSALDPRLSTPRRSSRFPTARILAAVGWLLASLVAWIVAFAGTCSYPWLAVAALATSGAAVFTAARRSWARLLVLPAAALMAGAVCGVLQWRVIEHATQQMDAEMRELHRLRGCRPTPRP